MVASPTCVATSAVEDDHPQHRIGIFAGDVRTALTRRVEDRADRHAVVPFLHVDPAADLIPVEGGRADAERLQERSDTLAGCRFGTEVHFLRQALREEPEQFVGLEAADLR